jgi:transposase InsO family protein
MRTKSVRTPPSISQASNGRPTEPLKIIGWGWYYLSTILDDFSRFIVAWRFGPTKRTTDVTATLASLCYRQDLSPTRF